MNKDDNIRALRLALAALCEQYRITCDMFVKDPMKNEAYRKAMQLLEE